MKLGDLCGQAYENYLLRSDTKVVRSSFVALEMWKKGDDAKTEEDEEDEVLIHEYIQNHMDEVLLMERNAVRQIVTNTIEKYSEQINQFLAAYGPKYIELFVTKSLIPLMDQQS